MGSQRKAGVSLVGQETRQEYGPDRTGLMSHSVWCLLDILIQCYKIHAKLINAIMSG